MQYKRILAVGDIHGIGGVTVRKKASLKAMYIMKGTGNQKYGCILRSVTDVDAFQSGRFAKQNGRPETPIFLLTLSV